MTVFADYADFYDLYYAQKDYAAEVSFVLDLASRFGAAPKRVLDMGCGTGRHLREFVGRGLRGDGFDRSERMLDQARGRLQGYPVDLAVGDLTSFRNGKRYDLVVSMFAVVGYLVGNEALLSGLRTAARHLRPGALFVFDGWFGPAVLSQKPEAREHTYTQGGETVVRRVRPRLDPLRQTVTVSYDIAIQAGQAGAREVHEEHEMRFLFVQETALALAAAGLELVHACPFLAPDGVLGLETWNACFVARRTSDRVPTVDADPSPL